MKCKDTGRDIGLEEREACGQQLEGEEEQFIDMDVG